MYKSERWTLAIALAALLISLVVAFISYRQLNSSNRAVEVADQARKDANIASDKALVVAEQARKDAVAEAEKQRIDAQNTLALQRKDAGAALEAQTRRADRANALSDRSAKAAEEAAQAMANQVGKLQASVTQITRLADAAEDSAEKQTRPWLGIEGPIELGKVSADFITFNFKLRNYGQSPGMIAAKPKFLLTFGGTHAGFFSQYKICEESEKPFHESDLGKHIETVFPGTDGVINMAIAALYAPGTGPNNFKLLLEGCIAYKSAGGGPYYTRVNYSATRAEKASEDGSYPITGFTLEYTDTQ